MAEEEQDVSEDTDIVSQNWLVLAHLPGLYFDFTSSFMERLMDVPAHP